MTQTSKPVEPSRARCCAAAEATLDTGFFGALSDPTRLCVLMRLVEIGRAATVTEVACCCPVDLSVVSRHLKRLADAGVVRARRHGKEKRYQVLYASLSGALREMADAIDACCPTNPVPHESTETTTP